MRSLQWQSLLKGLNESQRACVRDIEAQVRRVWSLGRNVIISWAAQRKGLTLLVLPYYQITRFITSYSAVPMLKPVYFGDQAIAGTVSGKLVSDLLTGSRKVRIEQIASLARLMGVAPVQVPISDPEVLAKLDVEVIDAVIKRYTVSYRDDVAVLLIDISKFSLHSPLEQMTQLNSLAYSLNAAHAKLLGQRYPVNFVRSTTGDGFYVWNRNSGPDANRQLYHLMQLTLADNAIAQDHAHGKATVPRLKVAFHIGKCYEFYQYQALQATPFTYIVGDVTIELARLIAGAEPGQILIGDFRIGPSSSGRSEANNGESRTAPQFIEELGGTLSNLRGISLSGEKVDSIRCYLTGPKRADETFDISRLKIVDKHGLSWRAYNAKVNIYRQRGQPIFLGLRHADLLDTGTAFV